MFTHDSVSVVGSVPHHLDKQEEYLYSRPGDRVEAEGFPCWSHV